MYRRLQGAHRQRLKKTEIIDFWQDTRIVSGVKRLAKNGYTISATRRRKRKVRRKKTVRREPVVSYSWMFIFFPTLKPSTLHSKSAQSGGKKIRYKFTLSLLRANSRHV